jgi:hypothetical protein
MIEPHMRAKEDILSDIYVVKELQWKLLLELLYRIDYDLRDLSKKVEEYTTLRFQ